MDDSQFDELETEAKLSLAELLENVRAMRGTATGGSGVGPMRMAQVRLTEVDQRVPPL